MSHFPSLEEFDAGVSYIPRSSLSSFSTDPSTTGATDAIPGDGAGGESSFLDRERAALGDDADLFATPTDNIASVEDAGDDSDDLLGGGGGNHYQAEGANDGFDDFESSFPAIDTNAVRLLPANPDMHAQHRMSLLQGKIDPTEPTT
jgi:hypothetical protein